MIYYIYIYIYHRLHHVSISLSSSLGLRIDLVCRGAPRQEVPSRAEAMIPQALSSILLAAAQLHSVEPQVLRLVPAVLPQLPIMVERMVPQGEGRKGKGNLGNEWGKFRIYG